MVDQHLDPECRQRFDRQPHGAGIALFIVVDAARHHDNRLPGEKAGHQFFGVAGNTPLRKSWNIGKGNPDGILDLVHQPAETRAKHDGDARQEPIQPVDQQVDGGGHPSVSVSKLKGRSSSMLITFCTPTSSQR